MVGIPRVLFNKNAQKNFLLKNIKMIREIFDQNENKMILLFYKDCKPFHEQDEQSIQEFPTRRIQ